MIKKCCAYGCDTNYASSESTKKNKKMKNLKQKSLKKMVAITKIQFQFFAFRKTKMKEKDGLKLYAK